MKEYEDYSRTYRHIESEDPEAFVWTQINSTCLAEVMELAENHGYSYRLNCYDENVVLGCDVVRIHRRQMIFTKGGNQKCR